MYFSRKLISLCSWENLNFLPYRAVKPVLEAHSLNSGTLLCSYAILIRSNISELSKGQERSGGLEDILPSPILSPPPPKWEDGVNPGHWGVNHRDACDQALMGRAMVFSTLLLPSAESSTQEASSTCLWERQVQATAFIWFCTSSASFCITFSSFTFHNANLDPNSFTLIQLLCSN